MTTLQFTSDLHIEYNRDDIPDPTEYIIPSADILILAGDIGSLYKIKQLKGFLERVTALFQAVLYIPGNHEYYTMNTYRSVSLRALDKRLDKISSEIPNLHILNRSSVRIGDICIVGCTLWSNPQCKIPPYIVRVHGMDTEEYTNRHKKDLAYINKMTKYCHSNNYRMVVVSHHPPSLRALEGLKKKKQFLSLYATDLEDMLIKENVELWICGHTHKNIDFVSDGGCRVVTNQKGKPKDRVHDYHKDFTIIL